MSLRNSGENSPKVLALETSTALLGAAVVRDREVLVEIILNKPNQGSSVLLPMCVEALERAEISLNDLSCIAVSKGPGSFTGLRIGVATAQGLAVSLEKRIAMVPSFEVMLYQAKQFRHVVIASGRAKAQAASAGYSRVGNKAKGGLGVPYGFEETIQAGPRDLDELLREVRRLGAREVHVTGDAAEDLIALGSRYRSGPRLVPVEPYWRLPRPGIVGLIGARMFSEGMVVEADEAVPDYYRKSQAEVISGRKAVPTGRKRG